MAAAAASATSSTTSVVGSPKGSHVPFPTGFGALTPAQQGAVVTARLEAAITNATSATLRTAPFGVADLSGLDAVELSVDDSASEAIPATMEKARRRVLITDLDGTLTKRDGRLPSSVFARLEALRDSQRVLVVVSTGRPLAWARTIMATWPVDSVVAENGAVVLTRDAATGAVSEENLFPSAAEDVAARAALIAVLTGPLGLRLSPDQDGRACDIAVELDEAKNDSSHSRGVPNVFLASLAAKGFKHSFSNVHLNIWRGSHDKGTGADAALAALGISGASDADVVFVGDSPNDRPCFERFAPHSYGVASVERYTGAQAAGPSFAGAGDEDLASLTLASACGHVTAADGPAGWLQAVEHAFPAEAFATLVANEFYVTGAVALAKSLIATGSSRPLVCLTGPEVSDASAATLAALGVTIVRVPAIAFSDDFKERHALDRIKAARPYNSGVDKPRKFRNLFNFSKLFLWALVDFTSVVYLDADTVVLQPLDELFAIPTFAAAHNLHVRFDQLNKLNSGVLVVQPSMAVLRSLLARLLDPASTTTYFRTDQTFLEEFFAGRTHGLDRGFNALQYFFVTAPEAWDWARVRVAHFIMQKPWQSLDDEDDAAKKAAMSDAASPVPPMPEGLRAELAPLHALWWAAFRARPATAAAGAAAVEAAGAAAVAAEARAALSGTDEAETKEDDEAAAPAPATATAAADARIATTSSAAALAKTAASTGSAGATSASALDLRPMTGARVLVVGGDGFCGWPLSLRLSARGYDVCIVDNLSRRRIDNELGVQSLTPIASVPARLDAWADVTKADGGAARAIRFERVDVNAEYDRFKALVAEFRPQTIVHLGEQRAAPYSMKDERTRRYTVSNNLGATHSVLNVIVEVDQDIHLVHLGTMGVYGYGAVEDVMLPEGYVDIKMKDMHGAWKDKTILHPAYPGSVYHMTKTQDALLFQFYAKNYKLAITDLHQGIVWGLHTSETRRHGDLINRLDYDSDYGTVLNRFVMQSACGHPLTVYGTGEQTRAFIHIENSMQCMQLAVEHPPVRGTAVRIFNQMTECHRLLDLVALLQRVFPATAVSFVDNPRKELRSNDLRVTNKQFLELGMKPVLLESDRVVEIYDAVTDFKDRFDRRHVLPKSFW